MKRLFVIAFVLVLIFTMAGCSREKKALAGDWYLEGTDTWYVTFYSDGTCKVRGEYGTCKWDIIDGKFRLTNFYGQMEETEEYSISKTKLVLGERTYIKK